LKLNIRIVDHKSRGGELYQQTCSFNSWNKETSRKLGLDSAFREGNGPAKADLVLCHVNDLKASQESGDTRKIQPSVHYVQDCAQRKIIVVLYSGDLRTSHEGPGELTVETNEGIWHFSLENPEYVLAVPYNVLDASRLPIEAALKAYDAEGDQEKKREALFRILRDFDPVLEAKLELLYYLLDKGPCIQTVKEWNPPQIPGLTGEDAESLKSKATGFFKAPNQEPQLALRKLRDELLGV